jgi:hypothetical protein
LSKAGGGKYGLLNMVCPGIWGGVINIIAGIVGIASCANENTATIVFTAILSILSLLGSACFTVFSIIMCVVDRNLSKNYPVTGFIKQLVNVDMASSNSEIRVRLILDILAISVGICVMFIALIQFTISAFSCCNGGAEEAQPMVFSDFSGRLDEQQPQSYPQQPQSYPQQSEEKRQIQPTPHYL